MLYGGIPLSAIQEWQALTNDIFDVAERQVDNTGRPLRIWTKNGLEALVRATAPGEMVGDSTLTREQALRRSAMFQSLLTWLNTPIAVGVDGNGDPITMSPIDLMSERRALA